MKLLPIQDLTNIGTLQPLCGYMPLTTTRVSIMKIPSVPTLLLLSANLLYKARLIIDGEIKPKRGKSLHDYSYQAIELMKICDDYENKYITQKQFNQIRREFSIKKSD